jgi:hypothetical protein
LLDRGFEPTVHFFRYAAALRIPYFACGPAPTSLSGRSRLLIPPLTLLRSITQGSPCVLRSPAAHASPGRTSLCARSPGKRSTGPFADPIHPWRTRLTACL